VRYVNCWYRNSSIP